MPFTQEQLDYGSKAAIDYFMKNAPVDQINTERPLIKKLISGKKEYGGGLENVVEQLRFSNDSNFQSYFGDQRVTYNRKRTLEQAKYKWSAFHDGFGLNEDELAQNGITLTDDRNAVASDSEKVQLTNLLQENFETLKTGFQENFDLMLHRDGTQSPTDLPGLDHLVAIDPTTGIVGGINAATATWWQNNVELNIATTTDTEKELFIEKMEQQWRECMRIGGSAPDFILVGSKFYDAYRMAAKQTVNRRIDAKGRSGIDMDASISGVYFKGVELIWDPVMDELDILDSPVQEWAKRCYFLNCRHITMRPIRGHWMVNRKPPRVYDRYVHYWGLTAKAALTTNKRVAHAVLTIA